MTRIRMAILLLLTLALPCAARVDLDLKDYERWQAYNGWRIQLIAFPGIHSFARADLLTVMATEKPTWLRRYVRLGRRTIFYADDFTSDLFRIERFYAREGFPRASVRGVVEADDVHRELRLKVEIVEGPPLVLDGWHIVMGSDSGAGLDSVHWSSLMPIQIGKRLAESDVRASADTLVYKLKEIGHARARAAASVDVDSVASTAQVTFTLYPGRFCRLGQTRITGLKQVSEGTARREISYHEFDPYSPLKLEATRRRLVHLETFNHVSVRADTATPGDTLTVWIQTEEGSRYRLRVGGGYDTEERSRAHAEFTDLNFFGRGRRLTWSGSLAEIRRRAEARLFWPHTPWNATDVTLAPKWELEIEPAFVLETQSATTILSAVPLEKVAVSISNEFGTAQRRDRVLSTTTRSYTKSVETFSLGWDTRDHPLVPRKGHFLGITLAESGAFYRTDLRWWRGIMSGKVLVPATRFAVLAGKSEVGIMGPLHDAPATPVEERFYLGGPSTVRGWARNQLAPRSSDSTRTAVGGDLSFYFTAEFRYNVWGPVTAAVFTDAGNVWPNDRDWRPLDLYPSSGLGLLFVTPVGPIRTDVAYQLRDNPYGQKRWAFHFSLGAPF